MSQIIITKKNGVLSNKESLSYCFGCRGCGYPDSIISKKYLKLLSKTLIYPIFGFVGVCSAAYLYFSEEEFQILGS